MTDHQMDMRKTYQTSGILLEDMTVRNPDTMVEVPPDGKTIGEIMIRGNIVMKGYLANEKATNECFEADWFHTGDLAVNHGNGRIEIQDRSKDIIISGGENISSIEVENILLTHPHILEVAVVAQKDDRWGEVPCAIIVLRTTSDSSSTSITLTLESLTPWMRDRMAGFKTPKNIIIVDILPKTVTGKVQKHMLRIMIAESKNKIV